MTETLSQRIPVRRPREGRVVAGVCAGFARYVGVDPVVVRVVVAVAAVFGGVGVLAYALGWLLLAGEGEEVSPLESLHGGGRSGTSHGVTVVLGIVALAALIGTVAGEWEAITVLALVLAAGVLLARRATGTAATGTAAGTAAVPAVPRDVAPAGLRGFAETRSTLASHAERTRTADALAAACGAGLLRLEEADERMAAAYKARTRGELVDLMRELPPDWVAGWERDHPVDPPAVTAPVPAVTVATAAPRRAWWLGPATLLTAAVAVAVTAFVDAVSGVDVSLPTFLAIALGVILTGFAVGLWLRQARWLILPALPLAAAVVLTSIVPLDLHGGFGERAFRPTSAAALAPAYKLGAGTQLLDLTDLDLAGGTAATRVSVGAGDLRVLVPAGLEVDLRATAGAGRIEIPGDDDAEGLKVRRDETLAATGTRTGTLRLDASVGAGRVEVIR